MRVSDQTVADLACGCNEFGGSDADRESMRLEQQRHAEMARGDLGTEFNSASHLFTTGCGVDDYRRLAGGPTRGADTAGVFVIQANGNVVGGLQNAEWFGGNGSTELTAKPGDAIFVPEEMNKTAFVQNAKDWTQNLYQHGIGIAGLVSATR